MHRIATRTAGLTAGLALSLGSLAVAGSASADPAKPTTEPCAKFATQVEKAETALAKVTAVFDRQQTKVEKAEAKVAKADDAAELARAEKKLARLEAQETDAKKAKKAQVQRLAKAQERLAACETAPVAG